MKKLKLLFLVPAIFAMTACGLGKEVDAAKAKEIAKNMEKAAEPDAMEVSLQITSYSAEEKSSVSASYALKQNKDGDLYAAVKSESTGGEEDYKVDAEVYLVSNEEYGKVIYMKNYDYDEKKDEISVYTQKGNNAEFGYVEQSVDMETSIVDVYTFSPEELAILIEEAEAQAKLDENISIKYYSKGDNNLTIEETIKKSDKEGAIWGHSKISFDNGRIVSMDSEQENAAGDKMTVKGEFKYPKSVKIELPKDWKDHIQAE